MNWSCSVTIPPSTAPDATPNDDWTVYDYNDVVDLWEDVDPFDLYDHDDDERRER